MNRWYFWVLAPVLLATGLGLPLITEPQDWEGRVVLYLFSGTLVLATLGLASPRRFQWALRAVAGAILLAFVAYAAHETIAWWKGEPASLLRALFGLVAVGVPSLYFLLRGRSGTSVDALAGTSGRSETAMTRHATFRSRRFESKEPKPHFINERCFGEDLAKWLREGVDPSFQPGEIIQEDYGWGFWTEAGGDRYWVYVGIMDESIGEDNPEWCVGVTYDPGLNLIRRLFRKPKVEDLLSLCGSVDAHLQRSTGMVEKIEWWHEPQMGTPSAHPA